MANNVKTLQRPDEASVLKRLYGYADNLSNFAATGRWETEEADALASVAIADVQGGGLVLTTGAVDNNQANLWGDSEHFLLTAEESIEAEFEFKFVEADTDKANIMIGFMNAVAADALQDNAAGPKANFSGAVIAKLDGETAWRCYSSVGTTRTNTLSSLSSSSSVWNRVKIVVVPGTKADTVDIAFFMNDVPIEKDDDSIPKSFRQIIHTGVDISSATEMTPVVSIKGGSAASEVLNVRLISPWQLKTSIIGA